MKILLNTRLTISSRQKNMEFSGS